MFHWQQQYMDASTVNIDSATVNIFWKLSYTPDLFSYLDMQITVPVINNFVKRCFKIHTDREQHIRLAANVLDRKG